MKERNCTLYSMRRAGKSFDFVSKVLQLDEPCTVAVIYKHDPQIRYMKEYIEDNLPYGVEVKWIKHDEIVSPSEMLKKKVFGDKYE